MSRKKSPSFFETYPYEYDDLTDAQGREKSHDREVASVVARFSPGSVLDAGCATGLTSRLFAAHTISTIGLDRIKPMVEQAQAKSKYDKQLLSFICGTFEALPKRLDGKFDLVVCLANSISGVGTKANLKKAVRGFYRTLRPGGHLVLQMLNYAAVKEGHIMPVRATKRGKIIYQRFSERRSNRLYLYVTRLDFGQTPPKFEIFRHEMDHFSPAEMAASLKAAGFRDIRRYSDLYFEGKFTPKSRDLVITAHKSV